MIITIQVLREEIGTAVRQIKSRTDQFSLIMHGQEGEGEEKEGFLKKEGAQLCVTHKMCHMGKSCSLGFPVLQFVPHDIIHGKEGEGTQGKMHLKKESGQLFCGKSWSLGFLVLQSVLQDPLRVHATVKRPYGTPLMDTVVNCPINLIIPYDACPT